MVKSYGSFVINDLIHLFTFPPPKKVSSKITLANIKLRRCNAKIQKRW